MVDVYMYLDFFVEIRKTFYYELSTIKFDNPIPISVAIHCAI